MCVFCGAFEAIYKVPVDVAINPSRQREYQEALAFSGARGKRKPCIKKGCGKPFTGKRQANSLGLDAFWELCLPHAKERAASAASRVERQKS